VAAAERVGAAEVPADAVTASGSGLDPDISPAYARLQIPRVAAAQGLSTGTVAALVDRHTSSGLEAFLGQPAVNVTALNLDVAAAAKASLAPPSK
jgi:K+-transporting ATPase ATPase C chain